ncbi:MAG: imelysin family protein [Myxococcales bacterium]|nr:imelysin family protein [Myxococcales bacterium]MCB9641499.1 imelysin family protein [Myxococcales bacterium]
MRRIMRILGAFGMIGLVVLGASCLQTEAFDRRKVLQDTADIVIMPMLRGFVEKAQALKVSAEALCKSPDEAGLKAVQDAWKEAKISWKKLEVVRMGPSMDLRVRSFVDWWPLQADGIDQALAGTDTLDVKYIEDTLGSNRRGLVAVEYLIFDRDKPALQRLQEDTTGRQCMFLQAALSSIETRALAYEQAWKADGGNYVSEVTQAGINSKAFPTLQSPIDQIINDVVYWVENVEQMKLAAPLGKKSGDTQVQPTQVESLWAKVSNEAMAANIEAVSALLSCTFGGKTGTSIYDLLNSRGYTTLVEKLKKHITDAQDAIKAISKPLQEALVSEKDKVEAAYNAVTELKKVLATEASSALGTVLNFTDNDGD